MRGLKPVALPLVAAALAAGCATQPPTGEKFQNDARALTYDALTLTFSSPLSYQQEIEINNSREGAAEGLKMMAAAPLGCLQGGMFAGICLAAAPFFPIIAAANVQETSISRAEMAAFANAVLNFDIDTQLRAALHQRLTAERVPLVEPGSAEYGNLVDLRITLAPMVLEHSGYKNGSITATLPVELSVIDRDGRLLSQHTQQLFGRFSQKEWQGEGNTRLHYDLKRWIKMIARNGLGKVLLEWQPPIELASVAPLPVQKRSIIGMRYLETPRVESLTPELVWEPLREPAGIAPGEFTGLTYEVEVRALTQEPYSQETVSVILEKGAGLPEPRYRLQTALQPCTAYSWQPRARFYYRGTLRLTSNDTRRSFSTPGPDCKQPAWQLPWERLPENVEFL